MSFERSGRPDWLPGLMHLPARRRQPAQGVEAVQLAASAGLILDPWQQWLLIESLTTQEEDEEEERWAASDVLVIMPRQNGKGSVLEARQLVGLVLIDERLQVHTAHEFKTSWEHFLRITQLIESTPDIDRLVSKVRRGSGEQSIEMRSGARLRFLARNNTSGRGMSAPTVYLDEAFALTAPMMGALRYAMSAQKNTQLWMTSSAPDDDAAILLGAIRRAQLAAKGGDDPNFLAAVWHADRDGDRTDPAQWAKANPAYPHRISHDTILGELRQCADDGDMLAEFDRERLSLWNDSDAAGTVIPLPDWDELVDRDYVMTGPALLALDVAPDGRWSSIVAVQAGPDGVHHLEVVERRGGVDWVVNALAGWVHRTSSRVYLAKGSPAESLRADLAKANVATSLVDDMPTACQGLLDAVMARRIAHTGGDALRTAIRAAERRYVGDQWTWSRRSSSLDISALVAATVALHAAASMARPMFAY